MSRTSPWRSARPEPSSTSTGSSASLSAAPGLLLLSHPNNPTGAVLEPAAVGRLAELLAGSETVVVVDELYARLVYEGADYRHLAAEPGMAERCVTLLGPSKTESLTGLRVGVVMAPPWVADAVEDVISITALRAPAYGQQALRRWLRDDHAWLSARLDELRAMRDHTARRLRELPWLGLRQQQATAYLFPDVSALGLTDREIAQAVLCGANVLVSPGYQFGPRGVGSFRICYARAEVPWDAALDRMLETLSGLAREQGVE
jgi:aspartate/methionine/tyrosine aminotransferase